MSEGPKDSQPKIPKFDLPNIDFSKLNLPKMPDYPSFRITREEKRREDEKHENLDTVEVPMGFELVTTSNDTKPYIGTSSLASCLGIGLTDTEHKIAGVAHVFFTEKETIVSYLHDSSGRDMPSSSSEIIVNKLNPFIDTQYRLNHLISLAREKGAKKVKLYFFNVQGGARTAEQNNQLQKTIDKALGDLKQKKDEKEIEIEEIKYRSERSFRIDSRTGQILPFSF